MVSTASSSSSESASGTHTQTTLAHTGRHDVKSRFAMLLSACSQYGGGSYYEIYVGDSLIKRGGTFTRTDIVQFP